MKRLRVRATPDPAVAPRAFQLLADSAGIEEARLVEANLGGEIGPTLLFSVDGDHDGLAAALREDDAVRRAENTPIDDRRSVLLLSLIPEEIPMAEAVFEAFTRTGLVFELPVVYRAGSVRATLLGEPAALQSVIDAFPDAVAVDVEEVGEFAGSTQRSALSDRQREAVRAGLELGYYDVPRRATHRDVAERLGCAPSTRRRSTSRKRSRSWSGPRWRAKARSGPIHTSCR